MSEVVVISPEALSKLVSGAVFAGVREALAASRLKDTYTHDEAADYLGVKPSALVKWRHEKRGPAYVKSGARIVYLKSDLDAWLASGRVHTIDSLAGDHERKS